MLFLFMAAIISGDGFLEGGRRVLVSVCIVAQASCRLCNGEPLSAALLLLLGILVHSATTPTESLSISECPFSNSWREHHCTARYRRAPATPFITNECMCREEAGPAPRHRSFTVGGITNRRHDQTTTPLFELCYILN